jgi:hypothetical protein
MERKGGVGCVDFLAICPMFGMAMREVLVVPCDILNPSGSAPPNPPKWPSPHSSQIQSMLGITWGSQTVASLGPQDPSENRCI